jgi:hypothetical protein
MYLSLKLMIMHNSLYKTRIWMASLQGSTAYEQWSPQPQIWLHVSFMVSSHHLQWLQEPQKSNRVTFPSKPLHYTSNARWLEYAIVSLPFKNSVCFPFFPFESTPSLLTLLCAITTITSVCVADPFCVEDSTVVPYLFFDVSSSSRWFFSFHYSLSRRFPTFSPR